MMGCGCQSSLQALNALHRHYGTLKLCKVPLGDDNHRNTYCRPPCCHAIAHLFHHAVFLESSTCPGSAYYNPIITLAETRVQHRKILPGHSPSCCLAPPPCFFLPSASRICLWYEDAVIHAGVTSSPTRTPQLC